MLHRALRLGLRCLVVAGGHRGCCVCGAEGGGRGVVSGLRLEGRVCSMLTVMLGGDLDVRVRVRVTVWVRVRARVG